jgi:hypothetical protein
MYKSRYLLLVGLPKKVYYPKRLKSEQFEPYFGVWLVMGDIHPPPPLLPYISKAKTTSNNYDWECTVRLGRHLDPTSRGVDTGHICEHPSEIVSKIVRSISFRILKDALVNSNCIYLLGLVKSPIPQFTVEQKNFLYILHYTALYFA